MVDVSVGLFSDGYLPVLDGVALTVHNYAYWLNKESGRSCVVAPRTPGYVDKESYRVVRFFSLPTVVRPPYRFGLPGLDLGLRRFLRDEDFSLIHAHSPFGAGLVAARTAKEKKVPLVATLHSKYRDDLARVIRAKAIVDDQIKRIADFYYSADYVWVPQESMVATLREYGYDGPYEVMENGIDLKSPESIDPG